MLKSENDKYLFNFLTFLSSLGGFSGMQGGGQGWGGGMKSLKGDSSYISLPPQNNFYRYLFVDKIYPSGQSV